MALDTDFSSISQLTQSISQTSTPSAGSCNMCKKKGLPILPVRYGIVADTNAHSAAGALPLGGGFGTGVTSVPLKKAKYTLRTLRYGYVYIFYPSTKRWQAYAVTAEGNLYDYPLDISLDRSFEKPFSCHQPGHAQLAQCITIDNAQSAGTVYLAFSDALWTKNVRDLYASNFMGCRDKRMQKLDATAAYNGNTAQPHAASVNQLDGLLNEYGSGKHPDAMLTGCFPYHDRAGQTPALKKAMDSIQPNKGVVFALWDAIGITQELNFEQRLAFGTALEPFQHGIWADSAIDALHKAVTAGAKEDIENAARTLSADTYNNLGASSIFDGGKMMESQLKSIDDEKEKELATADTDAWKPYTTHYRKQAITDFRNKTAATMKPVQENILAPLSIDHKTWLSSDALLNAFEWDYDPGDWQRGLDYTLTFTLCIEGAADRKEAIDQLVSWANGSVQDARNPLLRALVLNSPVLAEKVKEASSYPYPELREFVAKLIEAYSKIEKVEEDKDKGIQTKVAKALAHLLHEAGGPLAQAISQGVDTAAGKVIYATLCMRTKTLVELKAVYGSVNQWVNYVSRQMQEMMPGSQQIEMQDLNKDAQAKAASAGDADLEVKVRQFVVVESPATEAAALAGVAAKPGFQKIASVTLTPDVVEKIYLPKFRLLAKGEPGFNGIGAIFNIVNLHFARNELLKSNHFNSTENRIKLDNAWGGLASSVAQYGSATIEAIEKSGAKIGAGWLRIGRYLDILGKAAGAVVGLVSAAIDAYHAWDEYKHGNFLLAALYFSSMTVGILLVIAAFTGPVLALPLLILAAIIGVVINYVKGREINEWLEQCYFGIKEVSERFSTLAEDQKALASALS
ncbi:T6SS effector BTH_I2691 family protein [Paraburkholderia phosphatilytica]|uniref:T6SS effector BTH_I2691 family protein n=1 Tax=Paraburkholderia phosphatilytica TaxID=2282883 RepID=UPI000E4923D4|nr:T6SS effector BTH_I2691 family protein [Paraburkholderia phosphatilytica]